MGSKPKPSTTHYSAHFLAQSRANDSPKSGPEQAPMSSPMQAHVRQRLPHAGPAWPAWSSPCMQRRASTPARVSCTPLVPLLHEPAPGFLLSQLTIFYGGSVCVYAGIPEETMKEITLIIATAVAVACQASWFFQVALATSSCQPKMFLQNDIHLLNPPAELEKKKHKLKRLVQSPNSFFMDVK